MATSNIDLEKIDYETKKLKGGIFNDIRSDKFIKYEVKIKNTKNIERHKNELNKLGVKLNGKYWTFIIE